MFCYNVLFLLNNAPQTPGVTFSGKLHDGVNTVACSNSGVT